MSNVTSADVEALRNRLGPADEAQIRLLLQVPPWQRLLTMLDMQDQLLDTWFRRLRKRHPELDDLTLCRLCFKRLNQNG